MSNKYKVTELTITSNTKISSNSINTIGFSNVFMEIPSLTSFCVQTTSNITPIIYDSDRGAAALSALSGFRTFVGFDATLSSNFNAFNTSGNIIVELPKSLCGIKALKIISSSTMTSTCTIRVHVSG